MRIFVLLAVVGFTVVGPELALAQEPENQRDSKAVIALLNSRRTQATLLLYAPVISDRLLLVT